MNTNFSIMFNTSMTNPEGTSRQDFTDPGRMLEAIIAYMESQKSRLPMLQYYNAMAAICNGMDNAKPFVFHTGEEWISIGMGGKAPPFYYNSDLFQILNTREDALDIVASALSGKPTEDLSLVVPGYAAKWLMDYWENVYATAEGDGMDINDDMQQWAFEGFAEIFLGRWWNSRPNPYTHIRILGFDCSEVENEVPEDWNDSRYWEVCAIGDSWRAHYHPMRDGAVYRLSFDDEGFNLDFWLHASRKDLLNGLEHGALLQNGDDLVGGDLST